MFDDDVFGYDIDGDGFIDTPDRGSIFGYDFDGDGDIDREDDAIGFMLHEQAQKDVFGYDIDGDGFIDTPDRGSIFGYDFDGDGDVDQEDDFIGLMLYEQAQGQESYQSPRKQSAASASGSDIRRLGRSGTASRIDRYAGRPAKKRRFSIGGMTQWQSVIIIILGLAVVLAFCGIGAAVCWTMTQ